jgi:hypothetical protein
MGSNVLPRQYMPIVTESNLPKKLGKSAEKSAQTYEFYTCTKTESTLHQTKKQSI